MNDILYYTISNLTDDANLCSELLLQSLHNKIPNLNFKIIVPSSSDQNFCKHKKLSNYIIPINLNEYSNQHLFGLKFHRNIFELPYDYFVYLDSDILYFLNNLPIDFNKNYFCYDRATINNKFFSAVWPPDFKIDISSKGINAGFFMLNKETGFKLYDFMIDNFYSRRRIKIWYEQSMFNLFIYKNLTSNDVNWFDFSNNIILFADHNTPFIDNKLYHFCGQLCQMNSKYHRMKNFLKFNKINNYE